MESEDSKLIPTNGKKVCDVSLSGSVLSHTDDCFHIYPFACEFYNSFFLVHCVNKLYSYYPFISG